MTKPKFGYGWILKFLLAAILLAVGLWFIFDRQVVYTITGVAIVIFSLLRVVPLLRTLKKEVLRTINLIEIIFDLIIGGLLTYAALSGKVENSTIWPLVYKYGLAFVFYVRGVIFFVSTVFFEEKTEVAKFISHLVILTIGTVIATHPDFDHSLVGIILAVISFVGTAYLSYDGYNGYKLYRQSSKELNDGVSDEVIEHDDKGNQIEAPGKRKEKIEDERPYVN